ncbi:MAG: M36 family metallopeptidase [Phycisphaeraceae bacterium]|nr:M36 family metallopeptidase [Phycisphaeraceae bacterium]MCB9848284.1 M36 family metallopeptidase [Phycisphaeraceae bacterium]
MKTPSFLIGSACLVTMTLAGGVLGQSAEIVRETRIPGQTRIDSIPVANFDIRAENGDVSSRIRGALSGPGQARRLVAATRLENTIAGARVDLDPVFGGPKFVRSTSRTLTPPTDARMGAGEVVRAFVAEHADLFRISDGQIETALLTREMRSPASGARTLWWTQRVDGLEVFDAQLRGSVTADGALLSVSSGMLAEPDGGWRIENAAIDAGEALRLASASVGAAMVDVPQTLSVSEAPDRAQRFAQGAGLGNEPYLRLMLFPMTPDELRPAWRVVVGAAGSDDVYLIFIDAVNGDLLWRHTLRADAAQDATYNVYVDPVSMRPLESPAPMSPAPATPDGSQAPDASRTSVTVDALDLVASPDGWIPIGGTQTLGNNVDAHTDQNADNAPDLPRPTAGDRNFDFPINFAGGPASYEDASVVQLFYISNWFHDVMYGYGFDEAAANFQEDNFGRGGTGGDSVTAQAQDGGGTNNANFNADPTDGGLGRMQMYVFPGPTPDRDGSLDAQVVVHELTHGLSIRLHGGLFTQEAAGMGEGWSDFYAFALLLDPALDPDANYANGGWLTFGLDPGYNVNYYFGIRRYPYSTDFAVNPLTFADIDPSTYGVAAPAPPRSPISFLNPETSSNANEVHNMGEIWCNTLMQCRANLMAKHGGAAGNGLMVQLVTDAMKLSPSSPSLIQARDAVLLADLALTGGDNICDLWDGFAMRGFGASASTGDGSSATGLTEAFDIPTGLDIEIPGGAPIAVDLGVSTPLDVEVRDTCGDPLDTGSGMLFTQINGGGYSGVSIVETSPGVFGVDLPALGCGQTLEWYVSFENTTGGVYTLPAGAPAQAFLAVPFTADLVRLDDDFEADNGWVVGAVGDTATTGIWERVDPVGTGSQPEDDASPDGTLCYITGNAPPGAGAGTNDIDGGATTLMSPALDCTGGEAYISYSYWYSNNLGAAPNADSMPIDISNDDGANWTSVEIVTSNANAWVRETIRVADYVAPTAQVRLRFVASDLGDGSLVEAGVDEVFVDVLECVSNLVGDLNGDGVVDTADLGILLGVFGTNDALADLNMDGVVDTADLGILLANFGMMA